MNSTDAKHLCNRFSKFFVQKLDRVAEETQSRLAGTARLKPGPHQKQPFIMKINKNAVRGTSTSFKLLKQP